MDNFEVLTLNTIELYASKINALLSRATPRDLYDVNAMIENNMINNSILLRKCLVFYNAIGGDYDLQKVDFKNIERLNFQKFKTQLKPVIAKDDEFEIESAKKKVIEYLRNLLELTPNEKTVKVGGVYTNGEYSSYKVYLPKEELTSTTVEKWITVDLSDQFIYVGEDETLAFMSPTDPVICCYAQISKYNFIYDLGKAGRSQTAQSIFYGIYTDEMPDLKGKNISILGDSISTFSGISNNASETNSTIGSNAIFYPNAQIDKASETWWSQSANATGMNVLVNNSWSGSRVLNNGGAAYQTRCTQLHDDTGSNKGTNPDVIAVYIGINDFNGGNAIGSFSSVEEIYTEENGYIVPENVAQAYAIMIFARLPTMTSCILRKVFKRD